MAEAGVPDFEISSWNALYAPARAPQPALDVIRQATTEILSQDDVKAKFREIGFVAQALPPDLQDQRMGSEDRKMGQGHCGFGDRAALAHVPAKWVPVRRQEIMLRQKVGAG